MAVPGDGTIREIKTDEVLAFMEFTEVSFMESLEVPVCGLRPGY